MDAVRGFQGDSLAPIGGFRGLGAPSGITKGFYYNLINLPIPF